MIDQYIDPSGFRDVDTVSSLRLTVVKEEKYKLPNWLHFYQEQSRLYGKFYDKQLS